MAELHSEPIGSDVPDWIDIGEVTAPQGIRGEVRVFPLTDFPERFDEKSRMWLLPVGGERREIAIQHARAAGRVWVLKLAGVDEREQAEGLRGAHLQVPGAELSPLPEGSYYVFQLEGMTVFDDEDRELGRVAQVLTTGANDVYVVRSPGRRDLLIPATRECVRNVDLGQRRLIVHVLPGLEEL